jgi:hypothetical protein
LGFQQRFRKNARLGISITDIFNTLKYGNIMQTTDYISSRVAKFDTRAIVFTFAYTFNTEFKEKLLENNFSDE